jgi:uncharacterized protein (DUF488 family)
MRFWTIGHSNRSLDDFLAALEAHDISLLADVRRFPGSRTVPHFGQQPLSEALNEIGIAYRHFPELGGRRKSSPHSHNTAWRNSSFRAYADYMETPEFQEGVVQLTAEADRQRIAFMCSEAVWWRCHRGLIADYLKAAGHEVWHIQDARHVKEHPYTSAASFVDGRLSYHGADDSTNE